MIGLLAGVGALAIPGIGPIIAGGALASTLAGAGIGAAAGGLLGALWGWAYLKKMPAISMRASGPVEPWSRWTPPGREEEAQAACVMRAGPRVRSPAAKRAPRPLELFTGPLSY